MNAFEARTIEAIQIAEEAAAREVRTFVWEVLPAWWEVVHFPQGAICTRRIEGPSGIPGYINMGGKACPMLQHGTHRAPRGSDFRPSCRAPGPGPGPDSKRL